MLSLSEFRARRTEAKPAAGPGSMAHSAYFSLNLAEEAKLVKILFSNCSVDAVSITPTYRKPFDMIFKRARLEEWSGREDSNLRPPGPEPGALPDCATPRIVMPGWMSVCKGAIRKPRDNWLNRRTDSRSLPEICRAMPWHSKSSGRSPQSSTAIHGNRALRHGAQPDILDGMNLYRDPVYRCPPTSGDLNRL